MLFQSPCYVPVATSLPDFLDSMTGLVVEFPRFMVLGDFNPPSLGAGQRYREFMAIMAAMDVTQVIQGSIHSSSNWGRF